MADRRWQDLCQKDGRAPGGVTEALAGRAATKARGSAPGGATLSIGRPEGIVDRAEKRRRGATEPRDEGRAGRYARRQTAGGYFLAAAFYFFAGVLMLLDPLVSMFVWVVRRPRRVVPPPARTE